ncbi:transcriptional regulator, TetR family [Maribacter dokdonensis]|uniref:Transcriptional regulator, TetR family n=1 Tax=Maribacter dokdonensis TaxID=320912 RepID=A0A1H4UXS3_9FLAO|nr:TetR/AcrR family transcriptional regulator [Maribacter dokdonensis]SEC73443.1 transcriptional regulator, TetR family [Maribacter dokdonensis]
MSIKKEIFMAITLKLIYEKGFNAATMRDIAKNANFEVPNIYNYISSKEAILEGYIFKIFDDFNGHMENIQKSSFSPKDKLRYVISKHVQFTVREPYQVALFVYDWRNLSEPKLGKFKKLRKGYLMQISAIIAKGIEEKQFRPMNIEMATFLVFSSLKWLFNIVIQEEVGDNNKINSVELEKQILDYIFGGIDLRDSSVR